MAFHNDDINSNETNETYIQSYSQVEPYDGIFIGSFGWERSLRQLEGL